MTPRHLSIEDVKRRTAERKAKGLIPVYAPAEPPSPELLVTENVCSMLGERILDQPCGSRVMRCTLHDATTVRHTKCDRAARHCPTCPDFAAPRLFTYENFFPRLPGKRFNGGLIDHAGRLVFVWRDGWAGSNVWACELNERLDPVGEPSLLNVDHPNARYGREDPQPFVFGGRLHVALVGVTGRNNHVTGTAVLYARLNDRLGVEAVFAPRAPGTDPKRWEKNWGFFERDGRLHAVYSIRPHRILAIDGERAEWLPETAGLRLWGGGEPRGGACPVRVGDEYWSFFHDSIRLGGRKTYRVGLYAFRAAPPFDVTRWAPEPLLVADRATNRENNYCDAVFPRGAVRRGDRWLLASGVHDRWNEIRTLAHRELESRMSQRETPADLPADLQHALNATDDLPGWASAEKRRDMMKLILREKPELVVEVGVYGGQSLIPQAAALRHNRKGVIHAVDPYDNAATQEGSLPASEVWWASHDMDATHRAMLSAVDRFGLAPYVVVRRQHSHRAAESFAPNSIDVFHQDGNHSPEVSVKEVELFLSKVRPGGWWWLDDTDWPSVKPARALIEQHCALVKDYGRFCLFRKRP